MKTSEAWALHSPHPERTNRLSYVGDVHFGEVGEHVKQGEGHEGARSCENLPHERTILRKSYEEVTEGGDLLPLVDLDLGDHEAETMGAELAAGT